MKIFFYLTFLLNLFAWSLSTGAETLNGFDISDSLIPVDKIEKGGPPRDGIPSIDQPEFIDADAARFLKKKDRVIGVIHNGMVRAYPIKILNWHEIVNDRYADEAILISYCPLCNTGMVFNVQGKDTGISFGVSGLLYNSDVLLYDRPTGSLWSQILSKAISGPLKGVTLPQIPATHTTWNLWRLQYPDTQVLSTNTGFNRNYSHSPYIDYDSSSRIMFKVENKNKAYRNKELVMGIQIGEQYKAYPFKELKKNNKTRFTDVFAGQELVIKWYKDDETAIIETRQGDLLPSTLAYWFAWYAFYPDTEIFRVDN